MHSAPAQPTRSALTGRGSSPHSEGDDCLHLPELLAPAGDWDCAKAAVENGADAIYFGLEKFNARMRAKNFVEADLPELMEFLHRRGVRGYVTMNTLVFQDELEAAERVLRRIIAAGVDAAIVQDVGVCRLIRRLSPDFPIHASTQLTITSAAGVQFARELGCKLVVLARECSLQEIERIRASTNTASDGTGDGQRGLPLEVFVHGALCVAYSGQCFTSEALGGRSANRGECAQACRMPYELISDGQLVPLGDRQYLLSPQDLAGLDLVPDLVRGGISSLKIEGRLKTPEYVANITRIYRRALDGLVSTSETQSATPDPTSHTVGRAGLSASLEPSDRYDMEMAFSRGLSTGWLRGTNNQELVHARFGKKRGVYLGEVGQVQHDRVTLALQAPLKPGDGVVFDAGHPDQREQGGRVYEVRVLGSSSQDQAPVALFFGRGDIDFSRIQVGNKLWKTSDPALDRRLRQSFDGDKPRFQRPLRMEIHGRAGEPLVVVTHHDEGGHEIRKSSSKPLVVAERQPLTEDRLREQLGRLGGTPFRLAGLTNHLEGKVILPVSELNRLKREVIAELEQLLSRPKQWTFNDVSPAGAIAADNIEVSDPDVHAEDAELVVLCRDFSQLEAALSCGVRTLYCDFEDPKKYREAVRRVREAETGAVHRRTVWVAPPRIYKMGEEWILKQVKSSEADGYLVRNYDHLEYFKGCRQIGDFSLNIANVLTAQHFRNRYHLERLTASYDLDGAQIEALVGGAPARWFEVTIHQHMPMFHMEHCVFCAFLSKGTDYTNCGRPCDTHKVEIRDRVGAVHPLKADSGCRNTVFNALAQTGAEHVERLLAIGVRHFRLEFVSEPPEQVQRTIERYRALLEGRIGGTQLWRELKLFNQLGVTRGTLKPR